jgi:hypothetical protein
LFVIVFIEVDPTVSSASKEFSGSKRSMGLVDMPCNDPSRSEANLHIERLYIWAARSISAS